MECSRATEPSATGGEASPSWRQLKLGDLGMAVRLPPAGASAGLGGLSAPGYPSIGASKGRYAPPRPGYVGIVETHCSPVALCRAVADETKATLAHEYGRTPPIEVVGDAAGRGDADALRVPRGLVQRPVGEGSAARRRRCRRRHRPSTRAAATHSTSSPGSAPPTAPACAAPTIRLTTATPSAASSSRRRIQ